MPAAPRVMRVTPRGEQIRYPDGLSSPEPCLLVLHWGGRVGPNADELVPAHRIGHASLPGEEPNAVLVRWGYEPGGRGTAVYREDWFAPGDVRGEQPEPESGEWGRIVGRGVLG
jgi:hypothetical protein